MVGATGVTETGSPQSWCKHEDGEEEEDSADLEPDFAADTAEGAEEAGDAAAEASFGLCGARVMASIQRYRWIRNGRRWIRRCLRGVGGCRQAFTGNTTCYADSDAEHSADGLRPHFDMMVSVAVVVVHCIDSGSMQLP